MLSRLRKSGGSLVMTIPKAFVEQNRLGEGAVVKLQLKGKELTIKARTRPRYRLDDLMAEMPDGLPMAEGWDDMIPAGQEMD